MSVVKKAVREMNILPLEEFMALPDADRESYVNEQLSQIGEDSLQLLSKIVEPTNKYYRILEREVSGNLSGIATGGKRKGVVKKTRKNKHHK